MRLTLYTTLLGLSLAVTANEAIAAKRNSHQTMVGARQVRTIELSPDARLIEVYPADDPALQARGEQRPTEARSRSAK